jgi:5-methylcytosine-specific restriction enzyme B
MTDDIMAMTKGQRMARRMFTVLQVLDERGPKLPKGEVVDAVRVAVPPTEEERKLRRSGTEAWVTTFTFATINLVRSGWLTKDGEGTWGISEAGRKALTEWPNPDALFAEARTRYKAFQQQQIRRAWLLRGSAVLGQNLVPMWLHEGFCSVAASQLDLRADPGEAEVEELAEAAYSHLQHHDRQAKVEEITAFVTKMKPGDLVATVSQGCVYIGDIDGPWEWTESEGGRSNLRRPVTWRNADAGVAIADLPDPLPAQFSAGPNVVDLTANIATLEAFTNPDVDDSAGDGVSGVSGVHQHLPQPTQKLADELFVSLGWLEEIRLLLDERKQLVLYGPPGTGKTYIARALAEELVGPENVKLVQFHPAYTYEDFFEGYRPTPGQQSGSINFELRAGPLRRVAALATEHPDQAYVLIIDEINRANLAKVFGELYFLLEYRNQAVDLLYSPDERFSLPNNLYLIGTMNTADRSIALIDAAMRRRFAFEALDPSVEPTKSLLRKWSEGHNLGLRAAKILNELNRRIDDPDFLIGPSYFMKYNGADAFSDERLERIWRTSILPLLQEHFYGEWENMRTKFSFGSVTAAVDNAPAEPPQPA